MGEHRSLQIKRAQIVVDEQCQSMKKVHTHTHTHTPRRPPDSKVSQACGGGGCYCLDCI